jgi:hypothetical protein
MTNDDLLQELVHRMQNFSKYKLCLDKWNSFADSDGANYAVKITPRKD